MIENVIQDTRPEESLSLNTPVLMTERLVLRAPVPEDVSDLAIAANHRDIASMTERIPYPYSQDDAAKFIQEILDGKIFGHIYAITLADTGKLIGMCTVAGKKGTTELKIGYWLGHNWWGRGYATEAVAAVIDLAFRVTGVDTVYANTRTINVASRQILRNQGFQFVGLDEIETVTAGRVPIERYRLTRDVWLENNAS